MFFHNAIHKGRCLYFDFIHCRNNILKHFIYILYIYIYSHKYTCISLGIETQLSPVVQQGKDFININLDLLCGLFKELLRGSSVFMLSPQIELEGFLN